jgi:hypothetical protein
MPDTSGNVIRGFARNLRHEAEENALVADLDSLTQTLPFDVGERNLAEDMGDFAESLHAAPGGESFDLPDRGRPSFMPSRLRPSLFGSAKDKPAPNSVNSFTFFCRDGKLVKQPLYYGAPSDEAIKLKDPLLITMPYFRLKFRSGSFSNQEVLTTTFSKSGSSNQIGSEFVNYYSKDVVFQNGSMDCKFGADADIFGNDFLFYTDSYTGEDINLTIKAIEIDNHDNAFKSIYMMTSTASSACSLLCIEALPYIAGVNAAVGLLEKVLKILDKDDLICRCPFKLFHEQEHFPELMRGRYVCIFPSTAAVTETELAEKWTLGAEDNKLRNAAGAEYVDGSYFVLSVSKKKSDKYRNFDRQLGAAEILSRVNSNNGSMEQLMASVTDIASQVSDFRKMGEIDGLMSEFSSTGDDELLTKARAVFLNLSTDMKSFAVTKYAKLKQDA